MHWLNLMKPFLDWLHLCLFCFLSLSFFFWPFPGPVLVGIQIAATAVLGLTPTGKSLAPAPTALNTDADGARAHHPCLTAADTLAAG